MQVNVRSRAAPSKKYTTPAPETFTPVGALRAGEYPLVVPAVPLPAMVVTLPLSDTRRRRLFPMSDTITPLPKTAAPKGTVKRALLPWPSLYPCVPPARTETAQAVPTGGGVKRYTALLVLGTARLPPARSAICQGLASPEATVAKERVPVSTFLTSPKHQSLT